VSPEAGNYLFLGVGGMGMAPLAAWMVQEGYSLAGYDDYMQEPVRRFLAESGVELLDFVFPESLSDYSVVVHSSALQADHPILQRARELGMTVLRRGEMLASVASTRRFVAVVGSHGKTTTTGMIAYGLREAGIEADYILGGFFNDPAVPASRHTGSEWLVAEVDESDGTIESFSPEMTLILNVDWDHADRYADAEQLDDAFRGLIQRTVGTVLVPQAADFVERFAADLRECGQSFSVEPDSGFNVSNRQAACAVLERLSGGCCSAVDFSAFPGIARRQGLKLETASSAIYEDYAHHPTEIAALFASLRKRHPGRRLVVVFQGHRYSRTKQFKAEFAEVLAEAEECFLLPVYAAHEHPLSGGTAEDLKEAFGAHVPELLSMDLEGIRRLYAAVSNEACTLAFVGAGDIDQFGAVFTAWSQAEGREGEAWDRYMAGRVSPDCSLRRDEPLAKKTTMRVGGAAAYYAEPANLCDLRALLKAAQLFDLPVFSLGRGSNLIVPDEGYAGLVIRFTAGIWRAVHILDGQQLWAGAGVRLKEVCGQAAKAGLAGFEFLEGIPGSLGGSLRMNAGAMGNWMFDVVERVQMLDATGRYLDLPKEAFHFGYRKVEEISQGIALGAILSSRVAESSESIRERMDSYSTTRKASQPRDPSAGCIFKNPDGNYAGKLIDEHGIKGMSVGAAEVSAVHGNFIVNRGGATATDVIELVRRVRRAVKERSGYELEPEVLLLGQQWDELLKEEDTGDAGA